MYRRQQSVAVTKVSCVNTNAFQVCYLCFSTCGIKINTLKDTACLIPHLWAALCRADMAESCSEPRNPKAGLCFMSCSLYIDVANLKNLPSLACVWNGTAELKWEHVFWDIQVAFYLLGCKGQRGWSIVPPLLCSGCYTERQSVCETQMWGKAFSNIFSLTPVMPLFVWKEQCQQIMNYFLFKAASQIFVSH